MKTVRECRCCGVIKEVNEDQMCDECLEKEKIRENQYEDDRDDR